MRAAGVRLLAPQPLRASRAARLAHLSCSRMRSQAPSAALSAFQPATARHAAAMNSVESRQQDASLLSHRKEPRALGPVMLAPHEAASLVATPGQHAIVAAWLLLAASLLAKVVWASTALVASPSVLVAGAAVLVVAAWLAADLVVGIFHFFVDNYGSANTPVLGQVIEAFQGHHDAPWLITRGALPTVVEGPCVVTMPWLATALFLSPSAPIGLFTLFFAAWAVTAQLAHAWSHERRAQLPPAVRLMQDAGVFISCKVRHGWDGSRTPGSSRTLQEHRAHHLPPISDHYCILSGVWNIVLDRSGALAALERALYAWTGVMPRSWGGEIPATT
jgi:hypothetical protein